MLHGQLHLGSLMLQVIDVYGAVHGFWPQEELVELVDEPTGCVEVVWGGVCLL
jgi:hypothetical protein